MHLVEEYVLIGEVMLDILNPRLGKKVDYTQKELASFLLRGPKSKELLTSMKSGLSWVNKIVVVPISELSENEKEVYREINSNFEKEYKYIVIEGNTRVACLLNQSMREVFDLNEKLLVIVVSKSDKETDRQFLKERKRLQSISNVMIVKDWDDVPKAKQLFESYELIKEINPEKPEKEIFKELADTLGLAVSLVKKFIYRYVFYKELIENVEPIEEKDFKFFEIFEQNNTIRAMFGLDIKSSMFEWEVLDEIDDETQLEKIERKQELLYLFPKIIEVAKDEKISSKALRDIVRDNHKEGLEEIHQRFEDIVQYASKDEYSNDGFLKYFEKEKDVQQEERLLEDSINSILRALKSFPVNQDYACKFKEHIISIKETSDKILKMMEL